MIEVQYTTYASILKRSIGHWTREGQHFFLMKDRQAVEFIIEQGATSISETEFVLEL